MRYLLVGLCVLAFSSPVFAWGKIFGWGHDVRCDGGGCCRSGAPPEIVIPGSGYPSYARIFPPGCCQTRYAVIFPPGFGYGGWGRIIPTPGLGCEGPLPSVPLCADAPAVPPVSPER